MKKIATTIEPALLSFMYLMATVLLILVAVFIGQHVMNALGYSADVSRELKQSLPAFLVTAAVSMFVARKLSVKK